MEDFGLQCLHTLPASGELLGSGHLQNDRAASFAESNTPKDPETTNVALGMMPTGPETGRDGGLGLIGGRILDGHPDLHALLSAEAT